MVHTNCDLSLHEHAQTTFSNRLLRLACTFLHQSNELNWTEWTDIKWSLVCFKTIVWVFRWV